MTTRIVWMSLALALLATLMTAQLRGATGLRGPQTTAISIAPEELTRNAGDLPVTRIDLPY
jgi:hypothetical protein